MGTDVPIFVADGEAPARRVKLSSYYLVNNSPETVWHANFNSHFCPMVQLSLIDGTNILRRLLKDSIFNFNWSDQSDLLILNASEFFTSETRPTNLFINNFDISSSSN